MSKNLRRILCLALSLSMLALSGCVEKSANKDEAETTEQAKTEQKADEKENKMDNNKKTDIVNIKITLTNGKEIEAELYPDIAPESVENFVKLIDKKFFDGLIFHRVISGFMIQGGGFDESFYDGNFNSKQTDTIKGEFSSNGFKNDLKHTRGVLSMARTNDPNSASSQFFIMHRDAPHLDGQYAAFGKVTKGIEVVDEIAESKTIALDGEVLYMGNKYPQQMTDVPETPVVIKTIEVIE